METLFIQIKTLLVNAAALVLPPWGVTLSSMIISALAILGLGPLIMMYLTLMERKVLARMQNRIGPNRAGPWGLLQPLADGIKMLTKEDIRPSAADPLLYFLAPILIAVPALMVFAVIPFGKGMTAADLNVGVLYFVALSSTTTLVIFMASWGSRNKYSVLGGMRSVSQMISYEVTLVISVVPILMAAGSLSTQTIVESQSGRWYAATPWGLLSCMIFFICGLAECNRSPFDLPEAESEIVAGYHTEYSGMRFALFYMAEFMNVFSICALTVTLFLGGWQGPLLPSWLWFLIKTYLLIFIVFWFRGTLPRLRADHLMGLAWKFLLPLAVMNIPAAAMSHFLSEPFSTAVPLAILMVSVAVLSFFNKGYAAEKRVYHFTD
ncbi:MAG: NADH-quinone oxidoreductase subunit NuoH [Candidatus Omnitrophica bacterium]|nr:NADH-quinone oxidoreductase subunit NuoH [Candidatus Omnitrophota bacterium]